MKDPGYGFEINTIKISLVGDSGVGKTTLCKKYTNGIQNSFFLSPYFTSIEAVDNVIFNVVVCDVMENFDTQHRYSLYKEYDIILLCFSYGDKESLGNVARWYMEVQSQVANSTFILVGLKSDLLTEQKLLNESNNSKNNEDGEHHDSDNDEEINILMQARNDQLSGSYDKVQLINQDEVSKIMEITNAKKYMDCSVVLGTGINKVFKESIRAHFSTDDDSSYQSENISERHSLDLSKVKKSLSEIREFVRPKTPRSSEKEKKKKSKKGNCIVQ